MSMLAVSEAADRLGVTPRQVQHLVASGDLSSVARGFVDSSSVDRLIAIRRGGRARTWSEATAWGAVALLTGVEATWMGESQRSRLRAQLRQLNAEQVVARTRNRAIAMRYGGHPSAVSRVRAAAVSSHLAARRLGLADVNAVDAYVGADEVDEVARTYGLVLDNSGAFTLRATSMVMDVVRELIEDGDVVAALDLAESPDVRERSAGMKALGDAVKAFRG